jgi:class 3 adenylate cyclase/tetratricopeptide (TPR) repeat protein
VRPPDGTVARLVSYVAAPVLRRFAADPAPPSRPALDRFPAAAVLADVSGFTQLAARLGRRGPAGAEELSRILNASFGKLLTLVAAHGGEPVLFAGDALLALWPATAGGPGEGLAAAVCRAAQCALAVRAALDGDDVGGGVRLSVHAGLGAGDTLALHVGGVGRRWYLVVAGDAVRQTGAALERAQSGEVVLSPQAWARLARADAGEARADGCWRLTAVHTPLPLRPADPVDAAAVPPAALDAYVPAPVRARVAAGQGEWLAELRRVSALFLNLLDLDQTTPAALGQVQAVVEAVQPIVDRYEGAVKELTVDDKGATLVAIFGVPQAHEDDPVRCVRAALAAAPALAALGQRTAMGIATGRVFCGDVGSDLRRQYTVIGEPLAVAARLMQHAAGTILCDAATAEAARGRLPFTAVPAVRVKGRAEPLPVFTPRRPTPTPPRPQAAAPGDGRPLVGRVAERAALAGALAALRAGTGGALIVEGEAGLGKSRLVGEVLERAAALGFWHLLGAGDAIEQATPYYAWRPVVTRLLGLDALAEADPQARQAAVLAQLEDDPALQRLAPLLGDLVALDLPETALTRAMRGDVRADNLRALVVRLLQRAIRPAGGAGTVRRTVRPLVLVLEDAHWLDSASWALARQVHEQAAPLLLVLATRPPSAPPPAGYQALCGARGSRILRLEGLAPAETAALVCARLGAALPEPVLALIVARAEGNPFFSEELALALRDAGLLTVADGACRLAPEAGDLRALAFPDTVQGVVTSRIDRLSPQHQLTLKVASVIGRVFAYLTLRDVHPIAGDKPHLGDQLRTLERLDLTPLETPEPDLAYIFKHVITQEVAYGLLPFAHRRRLHALVAQWLERTQAGDLAPYYPLLAHHWGRAEDTPKTIGYLEQAGAQALRGGAYQEAAGYFAEALRLDGAAPPGTVPGGARRRARWEGQLGEAHYAMGHLREGRAHLERALALLGRPVATSRGRMVVGVAVQALRQAVYRLSPAGWLAGAGSREKDGALLEASRVYERLSQITWLLSEALPTFDTALRTLNLAEAAGPCPELARAYGTMSVVASMTSWHWLAKVYRDRARAVSAVVGETSATTWVEQCTAIVSQGIGDWQQLEDASSRARELSSSVGDRRRWEESTLVLSVGIAWQGNFSRSAQLLDEVANSTHGRGDPQALCWCSYSQARLLLAAGQAAEAVSLLEDVFARYPNDLGRVEAFVAHGIWALACWRRGEGQHAREMAERAARLIAGVPRSVSYAFDGYDSVAEVRLGLWEAMKEAPPAGRARLRREAQDACAALRRHAAVYPVARPAGQRWSGLYEWLCGRPSRAHRAWRRSLGAADRLQMPYEAARTRYEIGRHLPATDPARRRHLEAARATCEHLGATWLLTRTREALAQA